MKRTLWLLVICGMLTAPAAAAPGDDVSSGTNAFLNGDFDKSLGLLNRAIASGQLDTSALKVAYLMRGQAYFWKRDYIHAGDDFQAAAAIDPADQDAQGFIVYTEARKAGKPPPIPPEIDNAVFNAVTGLLFPLAILGHPVVVRSWVQLNPWFQHCMAYRYGFDPFEMVRKDINVDFNSLQPYVQSCTSIAAQERSETMAAVRQQARAKEQAKLDQEAAERRRQDERAAAAERRAREAAQAAKTAELAGRFGKEQATVIASGKVTVGMSKDAVIAAIGQPLRKQEITKDDELWIYDDRRISLSHGKVTYISR